MEKTRLGNYYDYSVLGTFYGTGDKYRALFVPGRSSNTSAFILGTLNDFAPQQHFMTHMHAHFSIDM